MNQFTTFPIRKKSKACTKAARNELNRRQNDEWFRQMKNARSAISMALRKYMQNPSFESKRTQELTDLSIQNLFLLLESKANRLNKSLWTDYGRSGGLEIDHVVALCEFESLSKVLDIETALKQAFHFSNLDITDSLTNKTHSLKPAVVEIIRRKLTKRVA